MESDMSILLGPSRAGSSSYSLRPAFEAHRRVGLAIALYNGLVCFLFDVSLPRSYLIPFDRRNRPLALYFVCSRHNRHTASLASRDNDTEAFHSNLARDQGLRSV